MKKLKLICIMLVILMLSGCAADMDTTGEATFFADVTYDWQTMTFTNLNRADVLNQTGNAYDDFVILHQTVKNETFSEAESSAYSNLFDLMDALVNEAEISYTTLSNYSSADFKDQCENYSVTVTVLDIITFNTYKSLIAELKDTYDKESFPISKRQYVESRLNRELSNEEFTAIIIMYDHYYMLADYYETQPFIQMTFDELMLEFKNKLSFEPIGDDLTQLQLAYDIIQSLKTT